MEENKQSVSGEKTPIDTNSPSTQDYIDAINKLKENSVSKDKYQELIKENKQLLNSLVNGNSIEQKKQEPEMSISELRNNLFRNEDQSNLQYCENALKLRTAIIKQGGRDPFLPYGEGVLPTDNDVECANRVARVMQECIDYAQGDSNIFTDELQRRMIDAAPMRRR